MHQTKVLLASRSQQALQVLQAAIGDAADFETRVRLISNGHADPMHGLNWLPEIVVLHIGTDNLTEIAAWAESDARERPALVVIGPAGHPEAARLAVRSGARDFLSEPLSRTEFLAALQRVRQELRRREAPAVRGETTAFVSAAGGAGASFVASNVAHALASVGGHSTALVDLDLNFAPLSHYLDLKPARGLLEALEVLDSLDEHALAGYSAQHASGLRLIGAVPGPVALARDVPTERLASLFDLLSQLHRHIVVDIPRVIDPVNALVFGRCKRVFIVLQQSVVHVRNAARLGRILRDELGVPADRIRVIVNRHEKDAAVELEDICRTLEIPGAITVPSHYRSVLESIDTGTPVAQSAPGAGLSRALLGIYREITGEQAAARGGLLRRALPTFLRS
jgi:pilus assembly protein CpaE